LLNRTAENVPFSPHRERLLKSMQLNAVVQVPAT
jgi:hypothetical protein